MTKVRRFSLKNFFQFLGAVLGKISFYIRTAIKESGEHDLFFYASSLSFQVVLCLIPTVFLVLWVLGTFLSRETLLHQLEVISSHALPRHLNSSDELRDLFMNRARIFTGRPQLFGIIGIIGLFTTSLALIGTIRKTVFNILDIRIKQSFIRQSLYDLRVLLIAGFFLTASTVITTAFTGVREAAMQLPAGEMRFTLIRVCVPIASAMGLTFLLYFSIYRFISFGKLGSAAAAFGAFWATVLYELAKNIFAIYIARIGNLGQVYGTLEVIIASLLWIFYSTCVFIFGVELSKLNSMRRATA